MKSDSDLNHTSRLIENIAKKFDEVFRKGEIYQLNSSLSSDVIKSLSRKIKEERQVAPEKPEKLSLLGRMSSKIKSIFTPVSEIIAEKALFVYNGGQLTGNSFTDRAAMRLAEEMRKMSVVPQGASTDEVSRQSNYSLYPVPIVYTWTSSLGKPSLVQIPTIKQTKGVNEVNAKYWPPLYM
ncbi:MAG: hypothetical protein ACP5MC_02800 [Candidatus Micrarchaeia archaeon]